MENPKSFNVNKKVLVWTFPSIENPKLMKDETKQEFNIQLFAHFNNCSVTLALFQV